MGRKDAPDDLFIKRGRHVWVEFKRPGKKPRVGQEMEAAEMRKAGCEVHAVDDVDAGCALFS